MEEKVLVIEDPGENYKEYVQKLWDATNHIVEEHYDDIFIRVKNATEKMKRVKEVRAGDKLVQIKYD